MDELLADFLMESTENILALDVDILTLETNPDNPDLIGRIFRTMHTIKGTCGFIGLSRLEKIAHAGENVLGKLRDKEMIANPQLISLILKCLDRIKWILQSLENNKIEPEGDDSELIFILNETIQDNESFLQKTDVDKIFFPNFVNVPESKQSLYLDEFIKDKSEDTLPPLNQPSLITTNTSSKIDQNTEGKSIRLNVDLLENLMTVVSELVLTRNQLMEMTRDHKNSPLIQALQRLNIVTSELQDSVMKTRMQPVSHAWNKLPRLIRDLSLDLNKKVNLDLIGAETELDRQVLELIRDPLTHMVRNSLDHGIELPSERIKKKKSEFGKITLHAYHQSGHIIIAIEDDGKGIDVEHIKEIILRKKLSTEAELKNFSVSQILQFIFEPGFSTVEQVTNISGRGVGMDVVKNNIEKIGGTIEIYSFKDKGTRIVVQIPLTLAIISGLIVGAAREKFAIPQICIVELVHVSLQSQNHIETIQGNSFLKIRNQLLPLCYLDELLELVPVRDLSIITDIQEQYVVVVQIGTQIFGIVVDEVFETQEIVVKPMSKILSNITIYLGNTILGDGSVVMILDPSGISKLVIQGSNKSQQVKNQEDAVETEKMSLLVFKSGKGALKAVPLELISRLEEFNSKQIEFVDGKFIVQYRDKLMPLIRIDDDFDKILNGKYPVLVFSENNQFFGLLIDEIIDIFQVSLNIKMKSNSPCVLGSAIINNYITEIINVDYYIQHSCPDWFNQENNNLKSVNINTKNFIETSVQNKSKKILIIDDSIFFRNLMIPIFTVQGYRVKAVETAEQALELYEKEKMFDLIICDIELPKMNGFDFATKMMRLERWQNIPLVAVSAYCVKNNQIKSQNYGFKYYISKNDRVGMLSILENLLKTNEDNNERKS